LLWLLALKRHLRGRFNYTSTDPPPRYFSGSEHGRVNSRGVLLLLNGCILGLVRIPRAELAVTLSGYFLVSEDCLGPLYRTLENSSTVGGHAVRFTYGLLWPSRWRRLLLGVPQYMTVFSAMSIGFKLWYHPPSDKVSG
jgi:hypothetical protein